MRAIILSLAAIGALSFALPAPPASAEEGIHVRIGDHDHDRGWRHRDHKKLVVIKHDRRHRDHDND